MNERIYDAVVIGGGSAGLASAEEIARQGFSVAVLEREESLGGILNQCIHNGFGLHFFKEELTGPEYAQRFIDRVAEIKNIDIYPGTTALEYEDDLGGRMLYGFSKRYGILAFRTKAIVLSMGCRERNRGNIGIPGTRPAGVFTAGLAQRLVNIEGYIPGKRVVIVGSGDIGLIMARRMTWVGSEVLGVVEIQPYPSGLTRNIVQCLSDFSIPLYLSHVISEIHGKERVEAVTVTPLKDGIQDEEKSFTLECDTLLLSVGLVPDNELSKKMGVNLNPETGGAWVDAGLMTNVDGIFACGNVLHVHDLVDYVSEESSRCGASAAAWLKGKGMPETQYPVTSGSNVKYVLPNRYSPERNMKFYLRSLIVKNKAELVITLDGEPIKKKKLMHIQPSEMISVNLAPEDLSGVKDLKENRLVVSII